MEDIALLPKLYPDLKLPALSEDGEFHPPLLPLQDWLAQTLPGSSLTLRQFIRRVCDTDGGAHVDVRPRAGLVGIPDVPEWIVKIGGAVERGCRENLPVNSNHERRNP
jgi:hypothetical protein